jgi:hypothetical protein
MNCRPAANRAQALGCFCRREGGKTKSPGAIRVEEPGAKLLSRANPDRDQRLQRISVKSDKYRKSLLNDLIGAGKQQR